MNGKAIAIGLGVLCAILVIALAFTLFYYNGMLQDRDGQISLLTSQISDLQNQVNTLNTQVNNLQNQLNSMTSNQVQVSGTVQATQTGTIEFTEVYSWNTTSVRSSTPITDGRYSVLLVGGKSYNVYVSNEQGYSRGDYTLYVPEGVTTFTADF